MGRKRRIWHPNMYYHVVMRGNNRNHIFQSRDDLRELFRIFHYAYDKHSFSIVAYCIMTNHYHLLMKSPEVPLGKIMSIVNRRYTEYYKKMYNTSGFLYESRYFAELLLTPKNILAVSRYIHRNPIETKVPIVTHMELYENSSYAFYKFSKPTTLPFLQLDILPSLLPTSINQTNENYCTYCEAEISDEKENKKSPNQF